MSEAIPRLVVTLSVTTVESALNYIRSASARTSLGRWPVAGIALLWWASMPVVAQTATPTPGEVGSALCDTLIVDFLDGLMTLLAGLGPMVGVVMAMISMVALSQAIDPEKQKKWRQRRNGAIKYGIGTLFIGAVFKILLNLTGLELAECIKISPF